MIPHHSGTIESVTEQTSSGIVAPELQTARLLLRRPRLDDADAYYEIASDPAYARFGSRGDVDRQNQTAALGYGIGRAWWGSGFATEAAKAALDYAFEGLDVDKVWARADPRNVGSLRVLEKIGMQREGVLRSHLIYRGERVDRVYFGLLRNEWAVGRGQ